MGTGVELMTPRRAAILGWAMWVLGVILMVVGAVITDRNDPISTTQAEESLRMFRRRYPDYPLPADIPPPAEAAR